MAVDLARLLRWAFVLVDCDGRLPGFVAASMGQGRWLVGETAMAVGPDGLPTPYLFVVADCNGRLFGSLLQHCGFGDCIQDVADWRDCPVR